MPLLHVNLFACAVIIAWSLWAVLSRKAEGGPIEKLLLGYLCLSAFAILFGAGYGYDDPHPAEVNLNLAMALIGLRQVVIRHWWGSFRAWLVRVRPPRGGKD